jgi:hypothetical protein
MELEDEFEEIVLGEKFDDAGAISSAESPMIELQDVVSEPETTPTVTETLEHFEQHEVEEDEEDEEETIEQAVDQGIEAPQYESLDEMVDSEQSGESPNFQHADLSAPASPEELREILGSVLGSNGRAFAAAAIAAVIGGLAFAWLAGDPDPSRSSASDRLELARSEQAGPAGPGSRSDSENLPAVLARLRGPVSTTSEAPSAAAAPDPASTRSNASTGRNVIELPDEEFDEELSEDELVDLRPAAMLPGATRKSPSEERFW